MSLSPLQTAPLLQLDAASTRIGAQTFGPYGMSVQPGERIAILGPSGAGKSTLLHMLARGQKLHGGAIRFDQRPLAAWPLPQLAQRRAVLPQANDVAFGLLTDLVIGLGRVAYERDPKLAQIVQAAADMACAGHLLGRRIDTLSGGEKARVQLARIFAQLWDVEQGLILVDEPLAALDPGLQFDLLDSIDNFAAKRRHAVIAVLHDINHALLGFQRLWLIKNGRLMADCASNVAAVPALAELYGIALGWVYNEQGDPVVTPLRRIAGIAAQAAA